MVHGAPGTSRPHLDSHVGAAPSGWVCILHTSCTPKPMKLGDSLGTAVSWAPHPPHSMPLNSFPLHRGSQDWMQHWRSDAPECESCSLTTWEQNARSARTIQMQPNANTPPRHCHGPVMGQHPDLKLLTGFRFWQDGFSSASRLSASPRTEFGVWQHISLGLDSGLQSAQHSQHWRGFQHHPTARLSCYAQQKFFSPAVLCQKTCFVL